MIGGYLILRSGQAHSNDLVSVKVLYQLVGTVIFAFVVAFCFVKKGSTVNDVHSVKTEFDSYAVSVFFTTVILFYRSRMKNNTINVNKSGIKPNTGKLVLLCIYDKVKDYYINII